MTQPITRSPAASSDRTADPSGKVKHFVLDTNVLLHNPNSIFSFAEHEVIIPFAVLEELDKFKKNNDDVGRNARMVIRQLDALRKKGHLNEGVAWNEAKGKIRVDFADEDRPPALREHTPDNLILAVAHRLVQSQERAVMVTKDINVRLKADALGIPAEDFESQKVDADTLYSGYRTIIVSGDLIDQLYEEKQLDIDEAEASLRALHPETADDEDADESDGASDTFLDLPANGYVQLRGVLDESHTGLARRLADTDSLIPIAAPRRPVFGIMSRNVQQIMALDLLLDDEVGLVTLLGSAGTGKTLLAIAAGMHKVFNEERYDKLLVARPIMPMGKDIGYLPGTKDEKLSAWMQPIFDNLTYLMSTRGAHALSGQGHADSRSIEQRIDSLVAQGQLVMEPLDLYKRSVYSASVFDCG